MNKTIRGALVAMLFGAALAVAANLIRWASPADYLNVALVPELADEVGADLPTRLALANEGAALLRSLGRVPLTVSEESDRFGQKQLERAGQRVYDLLSVEQRKVFLQAFKAGEAARVTFQTEPAANGGAALFRLSYGWPDQGSGNGMSVEAVLRKLERAYEMIPSETAARKLEEHPNAGVQRAAASWIAKNVDAQAMSDKRAEFAERQRQLREQHREQGREMRADHEERSNAMRAKQQKMRADHEARRAENEERFRRMREKNS